MNLETPGLVLAKIAAMLGASTEWDSAADYLEDIAALINESRFFTHSVSDQSTEALAFWRTMADALGIGYDDEDER